MDDPVEGHSANDCMDYIVVLFDVADRAYRDEDLDELGHDIITLALARLNVYLKTYMEGD